MSALFIALICAWAVAQLIKFSISAFKGEVDFSKLYQSGGMPSSHTAFIVASIASIGLYEGFSSTIFSFALVVGFIVVYDALGVRRTVGLQTKALEELYSRVQNAKQRSDNQSSIGGDYLELGTAKGHSEIEVFAGSILGLVIAYFVGFENAHEVRSFFRLQPDLREITVYLVVFIATILILNKAINRSKKFLSIQFKQMLMVLIYAGLIYANNMLNINILASRTSQALFFFVALSTTIFFLFSIGASKSISDKRAQTARGQARKRTRKSSKIKKSRR